LLGFTATDSGVLLVFRAGTILVLTPIVAMICSKGKVDPRYFVASGFIFVGISNLMLANVTTTGSDFWTFAIPLALSGVGLSQLFVPLTLSVLGGIEPREIPGASAFFNLSRQVGGSIAIAALVTILARSNAIHQTELGSSVSLHRTAVSSFLFGDGGAQSPRAISDLNRLVSNQALVLSFADTSRAVAYITLCLAPLAIILKRPVIPMRGGPGGGPAVPAAPLPPPPIGGSPLAGPAVPVLART
jgi:DHA2 family multidrug resistance protein